MGEGPNIKARRHTSFFEAIRKYPDSLKKARVTPIPKEGDKSPLSNYMFRNNHRYNYLLICQCVMNDFVIN